MVRPAVRSVLQVQWAALAVDSNSSEMRAKLDWCVVFRRISPRT